MAWSLILLNNTEKNANLYTKFVEFCIAICMHGFYFLSNQRALSSVQYISTFFGCGYVKCASDPHYCHYDLIFSTFAFVWLPIDRAIEIRRCFWRDCRVLFTACYFQIGSLTYFSKMFRVRVHNRQTVSKRYDSKPLFGFRQTTATDRDAEN